MCPDEHLFLDLLHRLNWPDYERLIFADWLDEHGREKESLAIRLHVLRKLTFPARYAYLAAVLKGKECSTTSSQASCDG